MGRRGPSRTPTNILKLRGSPRAKHRDEVEPKPEPGPPECPDWLDDESRKVWEQIAPMLDGMRILAKVDVNAVARYCRMFVRWREAEAFIKKYGETYPLKDEHGNVRYFQQFPQVAIAHKLALALLRIEQEFGLTPAARSRINVQAAADPEDALDEWEKKHQGAK